MVDRGNRRGPGLAEMSRVESRVTAGSSCVIRAEVCPAASSRNTGYLKRIYFASDGSGLVDRGSLATACVLLARGSRVGWRLPVRGCSCAADPPPSE